MITTGVSDLGERARPAAGGVGRAGPADGTGRTNVGPVRILAIAVGAAIVQASWLDASSTWLFRTVDLPLTLAAALVVVAPGRSALIGLAVGLAVDATGHRLFGIHCLAYSVLGPVARHLPVPGAIRSFDAGPALGRSGTEAAWLAAGQVGAASLVVLAGRSLADGRIAPLDRLVPTVLIAAALAPPLTAWLAGTGRHDRPAPARGRGRVGRWR